MQNLSHIKYFLWSTNYSLTNYSWKSETIISFLSKLPKFDFKIT